MIEEDKNTVLVSVAMITFNHEEFIAQAIEGVLMQQTDFHFELIIGEDCSTDQTRRIVQTFQQKYPQIIQTILYDKNVGMHQNFINTITKGSGKYIAICEGDDYWTDPLKLQKQFDFLENNSGYAACIHDAKIYSETKKAFITSYGKKAIYGKLWKKDVLMRDDLIKYWFCGPTASFFFRNIKDRFQFPEWYYRIYGADTALMILIAKFGKIKLLRECMSVYRVDNANSSEGQRVQYLYKLYKSIIKQNLYLLTIFEKKYSKYFILRAAMAAKILLILPVRNLIKKQVNPS